MFLRARPVFLRVTTTINLAAPQPLTEKADIYSMGMVFYSLVAGDLPYGDQEQFMVAYQKGLKPKMNPSWNQGFMKVSF